MTQYLVEEALTTAWNALEDVLLRRARERAEEDAAKQKAHDDVAAVLEAARKARR